MRRIPFKGGLFVPPRRFRAASDVKSVAFCEAPPALARRKGGTAAQRRGLVFERRTLQHLSQTFSEFEQSRWLRYQNSDGTHVCQPDGFVELLDCVLLFEVKYTHCIEAYWQLRHLYGPILAHLYKKPVKCIEVPRSFDPAVPWPEDIVLVTNILELALVKNSDFGVYWYP